MTPKLDLYMGPVHSIARAVVATFAVSAAIAGIDSTGDVEEVIVVTARKVSERLQGVPMGVTAINVQIPRQRPF